MKKIRVEMELPDGVWRKCTVRAAEAGLTFEEMLKRFAESLGCFTEQGHGKAVAWTYNCITAELPENTFLLYLVTTGYLETVLELHDSIQDCLEDLKINEPMDQIDVRMDIAYFSGQLRERFSLYKHWNLDRYEDETLAAGMKRVLEWRHRKCELVKQQGAERP